jgi:hypothetical protein
MISFGAVAHGFVDTDYYWSLSLKGPIESITVDPKSTHLCIPRVSLPSSVGVSGLLLPIHHQE